MLFRSNMGCCSTTAVAEVGKLYCVPISKHLACSDGDIRDKYSIKEVIAFNQITGIFYAEETDYQKDSVVIRISRMLPQSVNYAIKRFDIIKANKGNFINLLSQEKIEVKKQFIYIITRMPYMPDNLIAAVIAKKFPITEANLLAAFCPIFNTLAKMHDAGIIHGQISPTKFLLMKDVCYLYDPCIGTETTTDRILENFLFLSPEDLLNSVPSFASDVWSIAAVLYYLISGTYIFNENSLTECLEDSQRSSPNFNANVWNFISLELKDLLRKMLNKSKDSRIKMKDVLLHPWCQGESLSSANYLLNNTAHLSINYRREICMQKTKYFTANDRSANGIKELKNKLKEVDKNNTGYLEYGEIIQFSLKGAFSKCENCSSFWKYPIEYQSFLNDVTILNSLIMDERISVLFNQLSGTKDYLEEGDIKRLLTAVAHSDYTTKGVFEDLIRMYQNPIRDTLTLKYNEFLNMCQNISFAPSEAVIIGKFF